MIEEKDVLKLAQDCGGFLRNWDDGATLQFFKADFLEFASKLRAMDMEIAIKVCEDKENKHWKLKGTRDWSSYVEGMSDGAGECADKLRSMASELRSPETDLDQAQRIR